MFNVETKKTTSAFYTIKIPKPDFVSVFGW